MPIANTHAEYHHHKYIDSLVQECSNSTINELSLVMGLYLIKYATMVSLKYWNTSCQNAIKYGCPHAVRVVLIGFVQRVVFDCLMIGVSIHPWNHGSINDFFNSKYKYIYIYIWSLRPTFNREKSDVCLHPQIHVFGLNLKSGSCDLLQN